MPRDTQLKKEYLVNRKINELADEGIFVSKDHVEQLIKDANLDLCLFQKETVRPRNTLDVESLNNIVELLHADLNILYALTQKQEEDLKNLSANTKKNLKHLQDLINKAHKKAEAEIENSIYGKTVFYQDQGFNFYQEDGKIKIAAEVNISPGAVITFIVSPENSSSLILSDLVIKNNESKRATGSAAFNETTISLPSYEKINTEFVLMEDVESGSEYYILAGNQSILFNNSLHKIEFNKKTAAEEKGTMSFYIYNGSYATFDFNKQPVIKNFKDEQININTPIKQVQLKTEEDFDIGVDTDGEIYAECYRGIVRGHQLICPPTLARDFLVLEKQHADNRQPVIIELKTEEIDFILIKELERVIS